MTKQFTWTVVPFDQTLTDDEYKTGMSTSSHRIINIPLYTTTFNYKVEYSNDDAE